MAYDFPASPVDGAEFTPAGGPTYVWSAATPGWQLKGATACCPIISDTAPPAPVEGQIWFESDSGNTFIWYVDANSSQWVQINAGGGGPAQPPIVPGLITDYYRGDMTWQPRSIWADPVMQWTSIVDSVGLQFNAAGLTFGANTLPVNHFYWNKTTAPAGTPNALMLFPNNPDVILTVSSDLADATPSPKIILDRASPSAAANDLIGAVELNGRNAAGTPKTYVYITGQIQNPATGAENSGLLFNTLTAGTPQQQMKINGATRTVEMQNGYVLANLAVGHANVVGINGTEGASFSATGGGFFESVTPAININKLSGNGSIQNFEQGVGAVCGSISVANATTTAFNTTSDARLKEDQQPFDAGSIIDAISVYDFKWISSGLRAHGVLAQEAVEIYPEAIIHEEERDWWGVDYSKYVPLLLNEIKALRARVAALEGVA